MEVKTDTNYIRNTQLPGIDTKIDNTKTSTDNAYSKSVEVKADTTYIRNNLIPDMQTDIDSIKSKIDILDTSINNISSTIQNIGVVQITELKGLNGATCTTGSNFTAVVSVNITGAEILATCNSGNVSISGNRINISNCSTTGVYTLEVTAKKGSLQDKKSLVFFKI